ncbi:APC family permease [Rivularia sp. UHCC 0363]|uniref:APC family permease n=1 Tax=Rivularia sp. UHCC 0363 TaxID=3110244 RepID=UPI002B1F9ABB|nr:amino acid permease [Rivularia sp. UHCC 0363]MEA5595909.1 amino acid permease [Rivularia sp. UHCC 0363]
MKLAARPIITLKPTLSLIDTISIIVGVVVGASIFQTPSLVAANTGSVEIALLTWGVGGVISLIGALCYAELATTYPHPGGTYYYLRRAFGSSIGFLFAWTRMSVIQTGSIALLAFVFGDYASQLWRLGGYSASIYAAIAIVLLTGLNMLGVRQGKQTQNLLAVAQVVGLIIICAIGLLGVSYNGAPTLPPDGATNPTSNNLGLVMVFVLLSYGGWNEAAYISAEVRDGKRNIARALIWSIAIISALYMLVNLALIRGLGLTRMAASQAVVADLMRLNLGETGAILTSCLVAIATVCSLNATILTGARTNYALGRDFSVVTLYLLPELNLRLRSQLLEQLKPGTRIVSHAFDMGEWKPDRVVKTKRGNPIYLWVVPEEIPGNVRANILENSSQFAPGYFHLINRLRMNNDLQGLEDIK